MIINNQSHILYNYIKQNIDDNPINLCVTTITFNALYQLLDVIDKETINIVIDKYSWDNHIIKYINDDEELQTANSLSAHHRLSKLASKLLQNNISIRITPTGGNSFMIVGNNVVSLAPHAMNEATLGIVPNTKMYILPALNEASGYQTIFQQLYNNATEAKEELIQLLKSANPLKYPEFVYKYTVANVFENKTTDDINEERLIKTGFKNSVIWSKLFNFQKDAVLGAIDKIEKYNGCIIADSVGLGKTFEALAIIKYYELRNDRVLVLAPKKLRDNWVTYRLNDKRNILAQDRLNFDVLNHTDLSRETGMSGDINLETIHWENYDLIIIDESHNFRNNNPSKKRLSRYEKLMKNVIKSGVRTKVLLLSATPVNTRLNDIKNQLAFITEANDQALTHEGISSIDLTLSQAQKRFNAWLKEENHSRDALIERLDGDYFKLLDIFTISRSRKHIEKYYDVADIGKFPTRLKPISIYADFDTQNKDFSITYLNDYLEALNLKFYSPMFFVYEHKREAYAKLYDTETHTGSVFSQLDREESIITLMRVNLLKRLESSIHSFCLTLEKIMFSIDRLEDKIINHKEYINDIDVLDFDFDDENNADLLIGGKVKVLMQDLDLVKFKEYLKSDRKIIEELLLKCKVITAQRDQKLAHLKSLIEKKLQQPINGNNKKVIVFSAFADTVKYLYDECADYFKGKYALNAALITGSGANNTNMKGAKTDLQDILINFSPLSKGRNEVSPELKEEIDILFCTDCISEGQNLQDCDYLINYDIHWNPVRIIQRFGRIDRIGSKNDKIQLVNFYPDIELDKYIDLVQRVKGRMQILDISATGDDNVIDEREGQAKELDYRRKQLEKMKDAVVDLEDLEGGISISDLTFNDFKVDADRITEQQKQAYQLYAKGVFSMVQNNIVDYPSGVLFCLKDLDTNHADDKLKNNLLHPYSLVYITYDGEIQVPMRLGKKSLDLFKKLAYGKLKINEQHLKEFNLKTKAGKYMTQYTDLLQVVKQHLSGEEQAVAIQSLFNPNGSVFGKKQQSQYEIISYLIVL